MIAEEAVILPPTRIIAFNPQLQINDGNLTNSIMRQHNISYADAAAYVESCVWTIKQQLRETGSYELTGIGTLYLDVSGTCRFTPSDIPMPTPNLYALEGIFAAESGRHGSEASCMQHHTSSPGAAAAPLRNDRYVISVNKDIANYVAAAIVAIVCLFTWNTASIDSRAPQSASVLSVSSISFTPAAQTAEASKPEALVRGETPQLGCSSESYTIVFASSLSEKNAAAFVTTLKELGIDDVEVIISDGLSQVIGGRYPTAQQAQQVATAMRTTPQTKDCWVKKLK